MKIYTHLGSYTITHLNSSTSIHKTIWSKGSTCFNFKIEHGQSYFIQLDNENLKPLKALSRYSAVTSRYNSLTFKKNSFFLHPPIANSEDNTHYPHGVKIKFYSIKKLPSLQWHIYIYASIQRRKDNSKKLSAKFVRNMAFHKKRKTLPFNILSLF